MSHLRDIHVEIRIQDQRVCVRIRIRGKEIFFRKILQRSKLIIPYHMMGVLF